MQLDRLTFRLVRQKGEQSAHLFGLFPAMRIARERLKGRAGVSDPSIVLIYHAGDQPELPIEWREFGGAKECLLIFTAIRIVQLLHHGAEVHALPIWNIG